jgi:internalin A
VPVMKLAKLSSLDLAGNQISCIDELAELKGLSLLKLSGNRIKDIEPLTIHPPTSMLLLENNRIKDLAPLVTAAKVDAEGPQRFAPFMRVYLAGNPLSDETKKEQLPELKKIGVRLMDLEGQAAAKKE